MYKGREDELLKNLRIMKAKQTTEEEKQAIRAEVEALVAETKSPKSADDLLTAFAGQEQNLIKNLKKLKAKQDEIRQLAVETKAPKVRQAVN